MKRLDWRKVCLAAASAGALAAGTVWGQNPAAEPSQMIIIREVGKPEHRCLIEQAMPQADGHTAYLVRDLATGERMRVLDARTNKTGAGPIIGQLVSRITSTSDAGMAQALAGAPVNAAGARVPTTAELAGRGNVMQTAAKSRTSVPATAPAEESPLREQLRQLKDATLPSERERAAMTLTLSDARTAPEVVKALMESAKTDPAATVRTCGVRCLYRLSPEVPDVVPVIAALQTDSSEEVASTARSAMQEIAKKK